MPLEGHLFRRESLPRNTSFEVKEIVSEVPEITNAQLETMAAAFGTIATVHIMRSQELLNRPGLLTNSPRPHILKRSLRYGESAIVDTGSIDNLLLAIPEAEQSFDTRDVTRALQNSGYLSPNQTYLKFGTSGAVLADGSGAEVIEAQQIQGKKITLLSKMASRDSTGAITVARRPEHTRRVLLENEFIVSKDAKENRSIYLRLEVKADSDQDLIKLIDKAAQASGLTHYTVRATIFGPVHGEVAVIQALPDQPFAELRKILVVDSQHSTGTENDVVRAVQIVGSRSTANSRQSELWKRHTGQGIYPGDTGYRYLLGA